MIVIGVKIDGAQNSNWISELNLSLAWPDN